MPALLDVCPFDWTLAPAAVLHRTLCAALPDPRGASFILQREGIDIHAVNWDQPATFFWKEALEVSADAHMLRQLVTRLSRDPSVAGYDTVWASLLDLDTSSRADTPGSTAALSASSPEAASLHPRAAMLLERLGILLDPGAQLRREEREVLFWAAQTRAAPRAAARAIETAAPHLKEQRLVQISRGVWDRGNQPARTHEVRPELLAAIFDLAEGLLLDRMRRETSDKKLRDGSRTEDWIASVMEDVRVQRGVVTHVFRVGSTGSARLLDRWIVLRFDARWRRARACMSRAGLAVTIASPEIIMSRGAPDFPAAVSKRMSQEARAFAREAAAIFAHLGDDSPPAVPVGQLLPLPTATLVTDLSIPVAPDFPHEMVLTPQGGPEDLPRDGDITISAEHGALKLRPGRLSPGAAYRWVIRCDYGTGDAHVIAAGRLRVPAEAELRRCWAVMASAPSPARRGAQVELGLYHEILRELWPAAEHGASAGDLLLGTRILEEGLDWLRLHAPGSTQVDTLRNAAAWLFHGLEMAWACSGSGEFGAREEAAEAIRKLQQTDFNSHVINPRWRSRYES